jgi:hypothetical protein
MPSKELFFPALSAAKPPIEREKGIFEEAAPPQTPPPRKPWHDKQLCSTLTLTPPHLDATMRPV